MTTDADRAQLESGNANELAVVLERYRAKFERMISFRMNSSVARRLDPSDVLQESFIEISRRLPEFLADPRVPFFVWARQKVLQTLIDLQRSHLREKRDPNREVDLPVLTNSQTTSMSIARILLDDHTSPSLAAVRNEESERLQKAIDAMNETDREVLALRHFEQLTNNEVASILELTPTAASNRYVRAIANLSQIMNTHSSKRST